LALLTYIVTLLNILPSCDASPVRYAHLPDMWYAVIIVSTPKTDHSTRPYSHGHWTSLVNGQTELSEYLIQPTCVISSTCIHVHS